MRSWRAQSLVWIWSNGLRRDVCRGPLDGVGWAGPGGGLDVPGALLCCADEVVFGGRRYLCPKDFTL